MVLINFVTCFVSRSFLVTPQAKRPFVQWRDATRQTHTHTIERKDGYFLPLCAGALPPRISISFSRPKYDQAAKSLAILWTNWNKPPFAAWSSVSQQNFSVLCICIAQRVSEGSHCRSLCSFGCCAPKCCVFGHTDNICRRHGRRQPGSIIPKQNGPIRANHESISSFIRVFGCRTSHFRHFADHGTSAI